MMAQKGAQVKFHLISATIVAIYPLSSVDALVDSNNDKETPWMAKVLFLRTCVHALSSVIRIPNVRKLLLLSALSMAHIVGHTRTSVHGLFFWTFLEISLYFMILFLDFARKNHLSPLQRLLIHGPLAYIRALLLDYVSNARCKPFVLQITWPRQIYAFLHEFTAIYWTYR